MLYLTYGDQPSGVYSSQVIDVCRQLTELHGKPVPLVAFVSLRGFGETRKKIKAQYAHAIVLPSAPGLKRWRWNRWLLKRTCKKLRETGILARGPLATNLALSLRKKGVISKVGFDGRGAYHAEWNEYTVVPDEALKSEIFTLEQKAVLESDFRLAVSAALVRHWRDKYEYPTDDHVVIPCTLNGAFEKGLPDAMTLQQLREAHCYANDDIVLAYSGSSAGWQSFDLVDALLDGILTQNPRTKVLFLAKVDVQSLKCAQNHPGRVAADWVNHAEVPKVLAACDYGILVRENTVTNQVASPTKFAEYLSCGLKILISPNLGDYSTFVPDHRCGLVLQEGNTPEIPAVTAVEKQALAQLAIENFTKDHFASEYRKILASL